MSVLVRISDNNEFVAINRRDLDYLFMIGFIKTSDGKVFDSARTFIEKKEQYVFVSNDEKLEPLELISSPSYCYCGCGEIEGYDEELYAKKVINLTDEQIQNRKIEITYTVDEFDIANFESK